MLKEYFSNQRVTLHTHIETLYLTDD